MEERTYQTAIVETSLEDSTLIVLPTGLGKTVIALRVIAEVLRREPKCKALFLAPTKPLVEQHTGFLAARLALPPPAMFTGERDAEDRELAWREHRVIVATPQVIRNDLRAERIGLEDVALIVFDEAHRAVGDYAYGEIALEYRETRKGLVLGMTASPGWEVGRIAEVCENLGITNVEIRSESDPDVVPYTHEVQTQWIAVEMPRGLGQVASWLREIFAEQVEKLRKFGFLDPKKPPTTRDLLEAGRIIRAKADSGRKSFQIFQGLSAHALAMIVNHALELAETQGQAALLAYLEKIQQEANAEKPRKAAKTFVQDARFPQILQMIWSMRQDHPKLTKVFEVLQRELRNNPSFKAIVFTHYRDTCDLVAKRLAEVSGLRPSRFVGQAARGEDLGMRQREQKEILDKFRAGTCNVIVATAVGEEGLDVPSVDLILFYEPVPSEIRTIQRRGRTGRRRSGKVVVLVTKHTKDEAYYYSSRRKEFQMRKELEALRRKLRERAGKPLPPEAPGPDFEELLREPEPSAKALRAKAIAEKPGQMRLFGFEGPKDLQLRLTVHTDEAASELAELLRQKGIALDVRALDSGDYVLSPRVAVEREKVDEFLTDLSTGSLQGRLRRLKLKYLRPLLIVEGGAEAPAEPKTQQLVYEALSKAISELALPVLSTKSPVETADVLHALAVQEARAGRAGEREAAELPPLALHQEAVVAGLPNVSATVARRLLERFGSIEAIMAAAPEELQAVPGIGRTIAEDIRAVLRERYRAREGG